MTAAIVPGKRVPVHQPSPPPPTRPRRAQRFPFSVCSHSNGVYAKLDNGGAHCACAAPRASPSPAPSERARPSGFPEAAWTLGSGSGRLLRGGALRWEEKGLEDREVTGKLALCCLLATGRAAKILPPSAGSLNMPPSWPGRKRLAQSSETPMVSGIPGLGAFTLGFPLSAQESWVPPKNRASQGSS
uniref:Bm11606 n=1 Tax=Brugia malayi TaxID=6279 RepID=A0A1I9G9J0_BRUMA|nr:Bm11606 [Brugia malayi]